MTEIPKNEKVKAKRVQGQDKNTRTLDYTEANKEE